MDKNIFASVDQYISDLFEEKDAILDAAEQAAIDAGIPPISVSPNQGKFLQVLAKLCGAKRILEIGTLAGYSTIWMARALPKDGKLITLEYDPKHAKVAQQNIERAGLKEIIDIRIGKALDTLPLLFAEDKTPFDMIFIDADKPPYKEYLEWALNFSRTGTFIVADNVIRDGKVLNKQSTDEMVKGVQRFNEALAACKEVTATIIQTVGSKDHDGMALAVVK